MNEVEDLRRAFTAPGGFAPRPEDCPEPGTIWDAVHGELSPAALRDVVDHIVTCPACAEDWRLAVEADREERDREEIRPTPPPRRWVRFTPLAAAAAIVLLVVGLPHLPRGEEKTLRGRLAPVTSRLKADRTLPREHCLLLWKEIPGASYDLEVRDVLGERVFVDGGLGAPYDQVPAWSLAKIQSGDRLEWTVTAHLAGQVSHATFTFRLR